MESPAATRAFPGRGLLIALVALLPLTLAWGPNLNIPPTMIVTGAGLDTAYSSPASDSLEGEWLLGIRAFSTRIHFDDPVQLVWYGATAEIMRDSVRRTTDSAPRFREAGPSLASRPGSSPGWTDPPLRAESMQGWD